MLNLLNIYDKVAASGTAGLAATLVVGVLALVHVTLPAAVVAALVTLVSFVAGYLKTETHVAAVINTVAADVAKVEKAAGLTKPGANG